MDTKKNHGTRVLYACFKDASYVSLKVSIVLANFDRSYPKWFSLQREKAAE